MAGTAPLICIKDFEDFARQNWAKACYDYFSSGADDEQTLQDNTEAFNRIRLRPRLMRDVSQRDLSTTILGQHISYPIAIAPTALHRWIHPEGETATAKAAASVNAGMVLSTWSTFSMEEVAKSAPGGLRWLQIELLKDRDVIRNFVKRAEREGYMALFVTLDRPEGGKMRKSSINRKTLVELRFANFEATKYHLTSNTHINPKDPSNTWDAIDWLKSITRLPVVVKGILTAEDACEAVKHGVSGILVSNHGGRQLDGVLATIDVLPEVVEAVKGSDVEVYLDGGVRKGTDVLKALALGARVVFVGRPVLWGLAHDGQSGVVKVLEILREEFDLAMALSGCSTIKEITSDLVERRQSHSSKL